MHKPPGPGSGCEQGLTRGPHGLLPPRRDPGLLRPKGRSRGPTIIGTRTTEPHPGRLGGPRGQGPERTNPAPGKRRAAARIQNPSGTR